MRNHQSDAPSKQDHVEGSREVLNPHTERLHQQLHDIAAADKPAGASSGDGGGANSGALDNNKSASGNQAVDKLPKIEFYDSASGGTDTPSSNNHMDSGTTNSGSGSPPADVSSTTPTATPTAPGS